MPDATSRRCCCGRGSGSDRQRPIAWPLSWLRQVNFSGQGRISTRVYLQHHCAYTNFIDDHIRFLFHSSFPLFCDAKSEKEHHLSISPSHQRALAQHRSLYKRSTLIPSGTLEEDRRLLRHSIREYRIPRLSNLGILVASSIAL